MSAAAIKWMKKQFMHDYTYYSKLSFLEKKRIYILSEASNDKAFFSIAPLSAAAHSLKCDVFALLKTGDAEFHKNAFKVWSVYSNFSEEHVKRQVAIAEFVKQVEKKTKGEFEQVLEPPDIFLFASGHGFEAVKAEDYFRQDALNIKRASRIIPFRDGWFRKRFWQELMMTCRNIWKDVYALREHERVGMGFELVPDPKKLTLPLQDYLDSYAIINAMRRSCPSQKISMSAYTARKSQLEMPEKTVELSATLFGCELEKNIKEMVFIKYKQMAKALNFHPIVINDATFSIHGMGYSGKHIFGEKIGYPTPDNKSRWTSPGGIIYKFPWLPQTKHESRPPRCRIAFTETLPIEVFVKSCNVDWKDMRRKNNILLKRMNNSERIIVSSEKTNLIVHLVNKNGKRRIPKPSDADVRQKINSSHYKLTGIKAGNMANLPAGEAFVTPEYLEGTFFGDVVISIDQSYRLSEDEPLVVRCSREGYKIISGPKKILDKIRKKKQDAKKLLELYAKGSLSKKIYALSLRNFEGVGEFALNTNPAAELCDYLIVNEKIAGMIHIALGSGFEEDKHTEYHYDIVIDAKKQKLDIYGEKAGRKIWMLKKGRICV